MNAIDLFSKHFYSEINKGMKEADARNIGYQESLISTISSLFAGGLVTLLGMIRSQILSGISTLIAVRFQIMIRRMLFTSAGLTVDLFYCLLMAKPS